jgi:uncharacterized protein with NRDE domain
MCLIAWNWTPGPQGSLLLLGNRDEYYARPALPVHWWDDGVVLAGKDLQAGGTWMGVSRHGRLAVLTNYRQSGISDPHKSSRGQLVTRFLQSDQDAASFLDAIALESNNFNPFNLLVYDGCNLRGLQSRDARLVSFEAGLGAVSNADFHTPWPKLERLRNGLAEQVRSSRTEAEQLWPLLHDRTPADDHTLPDTGIPGSLEKALSSIFIVHTGYGTRACSIVKMDGQGVEFREQSHGPQGLLSETRHTFRLPQR